MASRFPELFSLRMASTVILEKKSLCWLRILELRVVLAMFMRSSLNFSGSFPWSSAWASRASRATLAAFLHPAMMVCGCRRMSTSFSASRMSSDAKTVTEVVPSPTCKKYTGNHII